MSVGHLMNLMQNVTPDNFESQYEAKVTDPEWVQSENESGEITDLPLFWIGGCTDLTPRPLKGRSKY